MTVTLKNDPNDKSLFSNEGVKELVPPPRFDYRGYQLELDEVKDVIDRVTHHLVHLKASDPRFTYTLADGRVIDSTKWNFWEWPQAIGLNGLLDYYILTSSADPSDPTALKTLKLIKDWYAARALEGLPTKNINSMSVMYSVACLLELDQQRGHSVFSDAERKMYWGWIDEWAEWVMHDLPRTVAGGFQHITFRLENKNQIWDDTLMMTVIPLTKIGLLLNRPQYIEESKYQFMIHIQYLLDPTTGLWIHGWEFDGSGSGSGHGFARALWGRGNCWITLAIPMLLDLLQLPSTDPFRRFLISTLGRQVEALLPLQDPATGLWRTVLMDPTSYVEVSATAGFVGGILKAIRSGYLPQDKYLQPALDGLKGCIAVVQPDGAVAHVSKGTPVGRAVEFYKNIPRYSVPYGQSLLIVALVEWMRLEQ